MTARHLLLTLPLLLIACDDGSGPIADDADDAETADAGCEDPSHHHQSWQLPPPTQIDYLFVIDDGPSMCEEQANLTRNFGAFSDFVFEELGASADVRIAVVRAGLDPEQGTPGAFNDRAAPPRPQEGCIDGNGDPQVPDTADCADLAVDGRLEPILALGVERNIGRDCDGADPAERAQCAKEDLERRFRCLATPGNSRRTPNEGLEAMRLALSCDGPNGALFGDCCVDTAEGPRYDPSCDVHAIERKPAFLRPDAILHVIFVADQDDCSSPSSNPAASRRAICRYGPADTDGDGMPDGFDDATLCPDGPEACYRAECDDLDPERCAARCTVGPTPTACAWDTDRLTPAADYYRFLTGLKSRPLGQLVAAAIVGRPDFTPAGHAIHWTSEPPLDGCAPGDTDDACCPDGRCRGSVAPSCRSENGEAHTGHRYLALARYFEDNGIACTPAAPGLPADAQRVVACGGEEVGDACGYLSEVEDEISGVCLPVVEDGHLACAECPSICQDDFARPLGAIGDKLAQTVATYCLDLPPACLVDGAPCSTPEERDNPDNYPVRITVRCTPPYLDRCGAAPGYTVASADWSLRLNQAGCDGDALVQLHEPPPAASRVDICYPPAAP